MGNFLPKSEIEDRHNCWVFWIYLVPYVFPSSSQWIINMFLKFSMYSPHNMFPIATHLVPYALPNVVLMKPIGVCQYCDLYVFKNVNTSILGSLKTFRMFL